MPRFEARFSSFWDTLRLASAAMRCRVGCGAKPRRPILHDAAETPGVDAMLLFARLAT